MPTTVTLSWTAAQGASTYDVRLGRDCDSGDKTECTRAAASEVSATSFQPSGLANNSLYFWTVTARNAQGVTDGPLWRFTTGSTGSALVADAGRDVSGENDRNLLFDGRNSSAPGGIAEWIWDFGDGTTQRGILPQVRHRYPCTLKPAGSTNRIFVVTLTIVENGTGRRASDSTTARVSFIYGGC